MANLRKNRKFQKNSSSKSNSPQKKSNRSALSRVNDSLIVKKRYKSLQTPRYFNKSNKIQSRTPHAVNCSICGKKMTSLIEAMEHGADAAPAHFTCVTKDLAGIYLPADKNCRIIYKGKGSFSVVEQADRQKGEESIYHFHSSIPYEKIEERSKWRENLVHLQLRQVLEI